MKVYKKHKYINTYIYTQMYTLLDLRNVQNVKNKIFSLSLVKDIQRRGWVAIKTFVAAPY